MRGEESNRAANAIISALEGNFREWLSRVQYAQAMPIIEEIVERELAALRAKLKEACDLEHEKHTALAVAEGRCELLERENAALHDDFVRANGVCDMQMKELAALRADKERLDWLARNRSVSPTNRPMFVSPQSLRASIDAARKEAKP